MTSPSSSREPIRPTPDSARRLEQLTSRAYDVLVIGGGINGAGIARAAARAGFSVLLIEKMDFGWGTTWRSTKLIHGGLRYLEHAEFGLVFESLRDQAALLREYPQMVRPLSFLLPVYRGDRHRPLTIGLGLTLYDALSLGRGLPLHRRHDANSARSLEPALQRNGLRALFTYSDCQVAYPERLCLQTVLEAREAGAELVNHAEATSFLHLGGRVVGARMRDTATCREFEVHAAVVINAAGPWVDTVLRGLGAPVPRQIGGTKGAHLVVNYGDTGPLHAVYAEARSDHRPFFILPWRGRHLVSTTDTRFEGAPEKVAASRADIEYLLSEATALLPGSPLSAAQVEYAYAGVRPLPASDGVSEGAITRRHLIHDHTDDGHPGLFSIIGGKLSTYRSLAGQTLDKIERQLKPQARTRDRRGRAAAGRASGSWYGSPMLSILQNLSLPLLDHLHMLYGPRLDALLQLVLEEPALLRPLCAHGPDIEAQVVLAARHEQAQTLADALLRRVGAGWNSCLGLDCAPPAAALMARELGWHNDRIAEELARYANEIRCTFVVPVARPGLAHLAADP